MDNRFQMTGAVLLSLLGGSAAHAQQAAPPTFPQTPPAFTQTVPTYAQQPGLPGFTQQRPDFIQQQISLYQSNFSTQQPVSVPVIIGIDSNGMPMMGVPRVQVPLIQQTRLMQKYRAPISPTGAFPPPGPNYPTGWSPGPGSGYVANPYPFGRPFAVSPR